MNSSLALRGPQPISSPLTAVWPAAEDGGSLDLKTASQAVDAMSFANGGQLEPLRLQAFGFGLVVLGTSWTPAHWQVPWPSRRGRHLPHEGYFVILALDRDVT